jgi:predicted small lipoprotein YifL
VSAGRAGGILLLVVLLAGCGMKGDLVLPDPEAPPAAPSEPARQ